MDYAISHHTVFMPAGEYIRKYRDEDKFIVFCRRCNRYDRCWACPPYDFDISARIGKYKYICITGTQIVPDPSSVPTIPAGTEKEVVIGLLTEVRLQLDSWLRWLETEYPGSLACYAGTCHLCPDDTCTRITGQPCRHPHLIRHSLESFGFDLGRTAEELLHIPLVWSDGVKFPEYLMLVSGLFTDVPIDISLKPASEFGFSVPVGCVGNLKCVCVILLLYDLIFRSIPAFYLYALGIVYKHRWAEIPTGVFKISCLKICKINFILYF